MKNCTPTTVSFWTSSSSESDEASSSSGLRRHRILDHASLHLSLPQGLHDIVDMPAQWSSLTLFVFDAGTGSLPALPVPMRSRMLKVSSFLLSSFATLVYSIQLVVTRLG